MRKIILLFLLFGINAFCAAQQNKEEKEIYDVVNQYIESFFLNDSTEMFAVLHNTLAKRGVSKSKDGALFFDSMSIERLSKMLIRKKVLEINQQENQIVLLDQSQNAASIKLITGYSFQRWVEYIHLLKMDNEWKIYNIVWDYLPESDSK